MNILAIDTSTEYLSLAISIGNKNTHSLEKVGSSQSLKIIPQIKELLNELNTDINSINLIAFNQGPGSFTGLRIGLSVSQGIALGLNIKLVPVPAFAIHAQALANKLIEAKHNKVLIGLDARLKQIYLAGIDLTNFDYFVKPQLISPENIYVEEKLTLLGEGFRLYHNLLPTNMQALDKITYRYPNALNIIAVVKQNKLSAVGVDDACLMYLRDKVALNKMEQNEA